MTSPTYLLVHGAWSGAWCWRDLTAEFDRRGVAWLAVDLPSSKNGADPSTSLGDDAAAVAATAAAAIDGPIVLVGHSYGGAVVTEVVPQIIGLERIAYIAALVPDIGQSATAASREVRVKTRLDEAIEVDGEYLRLNRELAIAALYDDCVPDVAQWATSHLSTQTIASFRSERTAEDTTAESLYLRCSKDHAIDPMLQEVMSARCHQVVTLDSGHSPFFSHPVALCEALLS
jgi:pimeloyl-ACP methyl ester carboxylesterase